MTDLIKKLQEKKVKQTLSDEEVAKALQEVKRETRGGKKSEEHETEE